MNDKNIEEKAKTPEQRAIEYGNKYGYSYETIQALANAYTAGCLSYAVFDAPDLSDTLTQYKEALRELVKMNETLGIDACYLFPEMENAIKLLSDDRK